MKAIFPGSDPSSTQVGDMDLWPVTWPNLSDLIGWGQQIYQHDRITGAYMPHSAFYVAYNSFILAIFGSHKTYPDIFC